MGHASAEPITQELKILKEHLKSYINFLKSRVESIALITMVTAGNTMHVLLVVVSVSLSLWLPPSLL